MFGRFQSSRLPHWVLLLLQMHQHVKRDEQTVGLRLKFMQQHLRNHVALWNWNFLELRNDGLGRE